MVFNKRESSYLKLSDYFNTDNLPFMLMNVNADGRVDVLDAIVWARQFLQQT